MNCSTYRFSVGVYRMTKYAITFELCMCCIIWSTTRSVMTSAQILHVEKEEEE